MVKYYCDWCNAEIDNEWTGGAFTRRVPAPEHGRTCVKFDLEFTVEDSPAHLCRSCYCKTVLDAVTSLSYPTEDSE